MINHNDITYGAGTRFRIEALMPSTTKSGHGAAAEAVAAAAPPQPVPDQGREGGAGGGLQHEPRPGTNWIKIGLPGKLTLSKRKGLGEVLFS